MVQASDFITIGRIGEGQFGQVDAVRCRLDNQIYAVKIIPKSTAARYNLNLPLERDIHRAGTRHAPPLFATFQTPSSLHMVIEYAACGSLWDRISLDSPTTAKLSEHEVCWWTDQMIAAIDWLHSLGYVHRDVKPQNFLLYPDFVLKLTDFGSVAPLLDKGIVDPSHCALPVGTPDYIAPEILRHAEEALLGSTPVPYTESIDWWSLGATVYELVVGRPPFYSSSITETYAQIFRINYRLPHTVSSELVDLFTTTLCPASARHRPSITPSKPPPTLPFIEPSPPDSLESDTFSFGDFFSTFSSSEPPLPCSHHVRWSDWSCTASRRDTSPPITPSRVVTAVPHSTRRRRPVSEAHAYQELLECVDHSARTNTSFSMRDLEQWWERDQESLQALYRRFASISESFHRR